MALLSLALNACGCSARSLSGSQAGIQTDSFFSNASIAEIDASCIETALRAGHVAVVAGFQGRTDLGDLTTLGRGGSDTTALALAAILRADRCEILKDVSAVYSADPRLVPSAHPILALSYDELLEMTYWGAKVLQYRSVEIAKRFQVPLYVGPAHSIADGTTVREAAQETTMIEDSRVLSLNSHETVLQMKLPPRSVTSALHWLKAELGSKKIPYPQVLHSEKNERSIDLFVTGPVEVTQAIRDSQFEVRPEIHELCSVTATCRGSTRPETVENVIFSLEAGGVDVENVLVSGMSVTVFTGKAHRLSALKALHELIPPHSSGMPLASASLTSPKSI